MARSQPTATEPSVLAKVFFKAAPGKFNDIALYLTENDQVSYLAAISVQHDLSANVTQADHAALHDFMETWVSEAPNIVSAELNLVMRLYKINDANAQ